MRPECVTAVSDAVGRPITAAESRNIETRVYDAMKALAREDPDGWEAKPRSLRLLEASERAAQDLVAEAALKKQRLAQTILTHDRIENYTATQVAAGHDADQLDALTRLMAGKGDGKDNATSAESLGKAVAAQTMGKLTETWDAIQPGMLGLLSDRRAEDSLVRALYGDKDAPANIAQAAKAWLQSAEDLRQRFNAAGGDVGKLDNWGLPQSWSAELASRAGKDKFADDFMEYLDRSQYAHPDGRRYSDDELRAFLGEAWLTIVTNGASKPVKPGAGAGGSVKANRGNQARQIHLKSPDAALTALRTYSGRSVFEAMAGHVQRMARDIALIETFGPNADHAVQHFIDKYKTDAARTNPTAEGKLDARTQKAANLYNYVAGNAPPPANSWLSSAGAMLRAWMSAAKLGSAAITSLTDEGTLYLTSKVNNLPLNQVFLNEVKALNLADHTEKRLARRAGLLVSTMLDDVDRFGAETLGSHVPQKLSSAVLRASGLNALTEARRRAFSITMMDSIGAVTRDVAKVEDLDPGDWRILRSKGITQSEWDIWRAAEPDKWSGNDSVLTPDAIYAIPDDVMKQVAPGVSPKLARDRAASKLLAVVLEERDFAVLEPGARERSTLTMGTQRGTVGGELLRSFLQFKTFPIAMVMRHWGRALNLYDGTAGKVGYVGALIASQTLMGAVALEVNDLLSGKDPRSLNPASEYGGRNLMAAVLKGGALSLYGDFLFADTNEFGRTLAGAIGGPGLGLVEDTFKLTVGNLQQLAKGEETDAGAEAARYLRAYTPGASLWYTKAATDRLIFHQLQEYFSPGYLARTKRKAQQNYGTTYWWDPGATPDEARAPDLGKAVAE